jgi:hypothetical protein
MASPLFFEGLRNYLGLELVLKVHLLQTTVLFFEFFHARHHGDIHAAVLGAPFVKGRSADAQLTANIERSKLSLSALDCDHDMAITEF